MPKRNTAVKPMSSGELKVELFVRAYLANGHNGAQAAIAAGYAKSSARQEANRLLNKPAVQERLRAVTRRLLSKADITAERTLLELARVGYADPRGLYDDTGELKAIRELDDDQAATIAGFEVETSTAEDGKVKVRTSKIRRVDKVQALGLLARHHKLVGADIDETIGAALAVAERMDKARERLRRMRKAPA